MKKKIIFLCLAISLVLLGFLIKLGFTAGRQDSNPQGLAVESEVNGSFITAPPDSVNKFIEKRIFGDGTESIVLKFPAKIKFSGLSFYFPGELSNQTSFGARKIEVGYENSDKQIVPFKTIENNIQPYVRLSSGTVETDRIIISFAKPFHLQPDGVGVIRVNDLKIYAEPLIGISFSGIGHKLQSYFYYWIFYLIFLLSLFIPGYALLAGRLKFLRFDDEFSLIISPVVGILIMFLSAVLFMVTSFKLILLIYPLIAVVSLYPFFRRKYYLSIFKYKEVILIIGITLFILSLVIAERDYLYNLQYIGSYLESLKPIPIDGYSGYFVDNLFPWRIARVYFNHYSLSSREATSILKETTVYDRTPVLPIISTVPMAVFGQGHFVFERFLEVLSVLFTGGIFVLFKRYFSKRTAIISVGLILLNIPIFWMASNSEILYKFFSIYPIILALIVFFSPLKNAKWIVASLLTLAFLIHPSTLIYSIVIIVLYLAKHKLSLGLISNIWPMLLMLAATGVLWGLLPAFLPSASKSVNNHSFYISEIMKIDARIIYTKIINLAVLLFPNVLSIGGQSIKPFSWAYFSDFLFLRYSIISNLSPLLFLIFIFYLFKYFRKYSLFILASVLPLLVYWFFYLNQADFFWNYGGAYFILYPFVVPMCLGFISENLLKEKKFFQFLLISSYLLFMGIQLYQTSGVMLKLKTAPIVGYMPITIWMVFTVLSVVVLKLTLKQNGFEPQHSGKGSR